jgi:hypothetical protein
MSKRRLQYGKDCPPPRRSMVVCETSGLYVTAMYMVEGVPYAWCRVCYETFKMSFDEAPLYPEHRRHIGT